MRTSFKWASITGFTVLLVATAAYWLWLPPASTMDRESYATMSAYLTQGLTGESHDIGSVNGLVVIYGKTTNGGFRVLPPFRSIFESRLMRIEAVVRSLTSQRLERKLALRAPYIFTNDPSIEQKDLTEAQQRAGYGTITFSKIIFNHDATYAVFYTEHLCGLCGEGAFIAMQKINGKWTEQSTWVS